MFESARRYHFARQQVRLLQHEAGKRLVLMFVLYTIYLYFLMFLLAQTAFGRISGRMAHLHHQLTGNVRGEVLWEPLHGVRANNVRADCAWAFEMLNMDLFGRTIKWPTPRGLHRRHQSGLVPQKSKMRRLRQWTILKSVIAVILCYTAVLYSVHSVLAHAHIYCEVINNLISIGLF